jgi:hypothetical protein
VKFSLLLFLVIPPTDPTSETKQIIVTVYNRRCWPFDNRAKAFLNYLVLKVLFTFVDELEL